MRGAGLGRLSCQSLPSGIATEGEMSDMVVDAEGSL